MEDSMAVAPNGSNVIDVPLVKSPVKKIDLSKPAIIANFAVGLLILSAGVTASVLLSKNIGPSLAWKITMGVSFSVGTLYTLGILTIGLVNKEQAEKRKIYEALDNYGVVLTKIVEIRTNLKECLNCLTQRPQLAARYNSVFTEKEMAEIQEQTNSPETCNATLSNLQAIEAKLRQVWTDDIALYQDTMNALRDDNNEYALKYIANLLNTHQSQ